MRCCWRRVVQTTPLAALITKFGSGLSARMLQVNGGTTVLSAILAIKVRGCLPAGMLLVNGNADDTFGGPCHHV